MNILVTGGSGFIGSNLVRRLLTNSRHRVFNLDCLTYAANPESLREFDDNDAYQHLPIDLVDPAGTRSAVASVDPDVIFHLAAESHVDRSIDTPDQFVQTNVVGTLHLLQAALAHWRGLQADRQTAFRFVHISTDEVYGSIATPNLFTEDSPYRPNSPYAASKASADHMVRSWTATYGLPAIVTNSSNNYGPFQYPEKLIPLMVLKCLREEPLPVYGVGANVRDWLYVEDHVEALLAVMQHGVPGESYNIGADQQLPNIDLVHQICSVMDDLNPRKLGTPHADLIELVADRPGHDERYAIDATKIRSQLSWRPLTTFPDTLKQTIQWYLDNENWWRSAGQRAGIRRGTGEGRNELISADAGDQQ